jgi:uncharacterized short protein YbdD (DUF466 family)
VIKNQPQNGSFPLMLRSRLSQMLIYGHINSAFRKPRASPERKISSFATGFNLLKSGWRLLRHLTGDDAYERYLDHCRAMHAGDLPPLDRAAFHREQVRRRWDGIKRCC